MYAAALRSKYPGTTPKDYDRAFIRQGGRCAICGDEPQVGKRLSLDHCHQTGKFRGLLCQPCNIAIGHLKDDSHIVAVAAEYLDGR